MISNPKKPRVLLDLYIKSQDGLENQLGPVERENLLKWAYLESSTFLKRYGDVLEEIRAYLQTRTSSPGECALLLEDML